MRQLDANHFNLILNPVEKDHVDTAIINTCGFILDAKNESIETILRFVREKKDGNLENLLVMGCLSERYKDQLIAEIPEVDGFFGVNELKNIIWEVGGSFRKKLTGERKLTTPSHYAYLKIAEGCNRQCSFCAIPAIRGFHVSRPIEEILTEAKYLAGIGVKELNIISQDTTYYGLDLYRKRMLPELLVKLAEIQEIKWIRLHYTYPDGFPAELLDVIRSSGKICNYVDIPLQHISSRILKSMRRGIDRENTIELVDQIREKIPGVAIRTTLITGYPGESDAEFEELKDFIIRSRFERLGVFAYSHEEDTNAFLLKNDIPEKIKSKRMAELMEIQQEISYQINHEKIGEKHTVIIDKKEEEFFTGRTEHDSPEVDNEVLIPVTGVELTIGEFYQVEITDADSFDLIGTINSG